MAVLVEEDTPKTNTHALDMMVVETVQITVVVVDAVDIAVTEVLNPVEDSEEVEVVATAIEAEIVVVSEVDVEDSVVQVNHGEVEGMGELDIVGDSVVMVQLLRMDMSQSVHLLVRLVAEECFKVIMAVERLALRLGVPLVLFLQKISLNSMVAGMKIALTDGDTMTTGTKVANETTTVIVTESLMGVTEATGTDTDVVATDETLKKVDVMMIETETETRIAVNAARSEEGINQLRRTERAVLYLVQVSSSGE